MMRNVSEEGAEEHEETRSKKYILKEVQSRTVRHNKTAIPNLTRIINRVMPLILQKEKNQMIRQNCELCDQSFYQ